MTPYLMRSNSLFSRVTAEPKKTVLNSPVHTHFLLHPPLSESLLDHCTYLSIVLVAKSHCFTVRLKILGVVSHQILIISL